MQIAQIQGLGFRNHCGDHDLVIIVITLSCPEPYKNDAAVYRYYLMIQIYVTDTWLRNPSSGDPTIRFGGRVTINYKHNKPVTAASIIPPTAVTHSTNMMQRVIFLKTYDVTGDKLTVELPTAQARVAVPGYYMLWIMSGDVPCKEAAWIKLG